MEQIQQLNTKEKKNETPKERNKTALHATFLPATVVLAAPYLKVILYYEC